MARKNDSPQKAAMREMMRDYLKNNDISIKSGNDVNSVMRDMISVLMEGVLDIDISDSTISRITDKILPIVKEW